MISVNPMTSQLRSTYIVSHGASIALKPHCSTMSTNFDDTNNNMYDNAAGQTGGATIQPRYGLAAAGRVPATAPGGKYAGTEPLPASMRSSEDALAPSHHRHNPDEPVRAAGGYDNFGGYDAKANQWETENRNTDWNNDVEGDADAGTRERPLGTRPVPEGK